MTQPSPIPAIATPIPLVTRGTADRGEAKMREVATQLEASFLAEMLGHAGLGAMEGSFGGGIGEEQFSSFLRERQAMQMARAGGIGLAETIFQSMKAKAGA